jgi:hypothetical protein
MQNQIKETLTTTKNQSNTQKSIKYYEKKEELINQLSNLHKTINPYTFEYIRIITPLADVLYEIKKSIDDLTRLARKCKPINETTAQVHFRSRNGLKLDVRSISIEIGVEQYGRTFKFLEIMSERFKHHSESIFLNKLKYKTDNCPSKLF